MTDDGRYAALSALAPARDAVQRLSPARDPEDTAADLVDAWTAIEAALRALLGGAILSGQELVREVRKRDFLTLTQAHALLDFLSVRDRLEDTGYKPTAADVQAARKAVAELDSGLSASRAGPAATPARASAAPPAPPTEAPAATGEARGRLERLPTWAWIVVAAVGLGLAGLGALYAAGRDGGDLADARRLLREGKREAARAEFERVARENPREAEARLFLARMARDEGDYTTAQREAEAAIRAEPRNGIAHREMGTLMYVAGNYELARAFFVRAVEFRPADSTAMGLLGCSLVRLGRRDQGLRFLSRAGPGAWSDCAR